jgi:hypothetical protein
MRSPIREALPANAVWEHWGAARAFPASQSGNQYAPRRAGICERQDRASHKAASRPKRNGAAASCAARDRREAVDGRAEPALVSIPEGRRVRLSVNARGAQAEFTRGSDESGRQLSGGGLHASGIDQNV